MRHKRGLEEQEEAALQCTESFQRPRNEGVFNINRNKEPAGSFLR